MIVQRFYCLPDGQFFGSWTGDPQSDHDPLAAQQYVEVPYAPQSTDYFWDAEGQAFYLPPSPAIEREWRDREMAELVWIRDRHRDQLEMAVDTALDTDQFAAFLVYLQQLRDWPQADEFPDVAARPVAPVFLEQFRSVV
ncbi:phage tail assembly chaperone [Pseudomonas sp. NY15463]|uniref:phage tail assembly chaperone n=1 Tax=Pseudomonas sp. NY15463 TaxID=3400361 RepID=UPI003A87E040